MRKSLRLRKLTALLIVVMVLGWSGAAWGVYWTNLIDQMTPLDASGPESTTEVNQTYIDLTNVSSGSVTSATYIGADQVRTDNSYTVASQTYMEAMGRITSFIFELSNQYRPDTDLALSGVDYLPTVHVYTYGVQKDQAMYSVVSGLVECLGNPPIRNHGDSSSSWVNNYSPTAISSKTITSFKIGESTITTSSGTITMDVTPYVKDNRTYTPVRYLAYALGVPEEGILWDEATQTVTITKDDTTLKLTIGSTTLTKNSEITDMDVAPELVDPGRTMLPARWVSEALGATVTWDEKTQQVTIEITQQEQS
ncbi:MAG: hypothetical protein A4E55_00225 [Pelotomaculum sp. PtaU1.Bin035]|nr:MAG: hypothetical protein A4E55_00225 [Pelotomaculum sp. PtaU1.Bin035]